MIQFTEVPDTNIVEFLIDGSVDAADFDRVIPLFVAAAEKHDSLRLLKQIKDVDKINPAGFGEQMGDVFAHLGDITHAAIVADKEWDPRWVRWAPSTRSK